MLQLRNPPGLAGAELLMACAAQQQLRQDSDANRLLDPSFLRTDWGLAPPEVRLQLAVDLFYGPSSLVCAYHLSREPLIQSGHQDFRLLRAEVAPSFTQDHRDLTEVPQTQARARHPEDFTTLRTREPGPPRPLLIFAWQMRHQVFNGLVLDRFPRPGNGEHQAPPTSRIVRVALQDPLHLLVGTRGRVALDHDALGPGGGHNG
jgi:hypothetical protein